jgi:hypothetical protein
MNPDQKVILRDAVVFAVKLAIDSVKDVVLAFACLGAATIDFLRGPGPNGYFFYRLMKMGQRIDAELNLYGHSEPPQPIPEK